jgi:hypothetical protein
MTAGFVTEYPVPTLSALLAIAPGPDGAWEAYIRLDSSGRDLSLRECSSHRNRFQR